MRFLTTIALIASTLVAPAAIGQPPDELLSLAENRMESAAEMWTTDPEFGEKGYAEAAKIYRRIIDEHGIESCGLYRCLGNAHYLSGDVGRAVLNFRRAERLDPRDDRTKASLSLARSLVRTEVTPSTTSRMKRALLWWRGLVPREWLWIGFVGGYVVFWCVRATAIGAGNSVTQLGSWAAAIISVTSIAALATEPLLDDPSSEAVIVQDETIGRNGPSNEVYLATFESPLRAGVEGTIIERREGWIRLRLASGQETWVPGEAVESVAPAVSAGDSTIDENSDFDGDD